MSAHSRATLLLIAAAPLASGFRATAGLRTAVRPLDVHMTSNAGPKAAAAAAAIAALSTALPAEAARSGGRVGGRVGGGGGGYRGGGGGGYRGGGGGAYMARPMMSPFGFR